ncbi:hypothetical protein B0H11DRAFT_2264497 [Mycena galericulata]|nr:hypothetical protein B0H11DRAFT_2264497 [Mycena galericulata]
MSSPSSCPVPFYYDPGQPDSPLPNQKLYLVFGRNVACPGAYASWPSADAQYKSVSDATLKSYKLWEPLEAAWVASCGRGEHPHPPATTNGCGMRLIYESPFGAGRTMSGPPAPAPVPASPAIGKMASPATRTITPTTPVHRSTPGPQRLRQSNHVPQPLRQSIPATSPASPTPSGAPNKARVTVGNESPGVQTIPGKNAYAVRDGAQGAIFDEFRAARDMYHRLQSEGKSPSLWTGPSLTDAVCFVENFRTQGVSPEAGRRRKWIEEEYEARHQLLVDLGVDIWQSSRDDEWKTDSDVSDCSDSSAGSTEVG